MSETLPKGWIETTLDNIADWGSGGTPKATEKKFYNGNIPWLIIADLNNGIVTKSNNLINEIGLNSSSAKWVETGSVLIAMYGSIGKLGIAGIRCTTNQAIAFTSAIWGGIPNWYLFYYLKYQEPDLLSIGQGGAQKNISQTILKKYPIPLPPLNEQKRIVAKIDQIMPRIDAVKERLDKVPAIVKRFRQSVLTAAVTGKLTEQWRADHPDVESAEGLWPTNRRIISHEEYRNMWNDFEIPESWTCVYLKEIADLRLGKMLDTNKNIGIETKYIRNVNVRWFQFELDDLKSIKIQSEEIKKLSINNGDVFICEGGEPGRAAVWKLGKNEMTFQKALHRVRVIGKLVPDWLVYNLKVDADTDRLNELFTGSTIKHFTGRSLAVYPLALPPLAEQHEIVRQVDKLFALADRLESHYQKAKARVDKLSQSVLAKAFRGELVITEAELAEKEGRDFETAEKLLERIIEEKAKLVGSRQSAGGRKTVKRTETGRKKK